jgi:hypothetical protein
MAGSQSITQSEAIRRLKDIYGIEADLHNESFDVFEQLAACESTPFVVEVKDYTQQEDTSTPDDTTEITNGNATVSEHDNGTYQRVVNETLAIRKIQIIKALQSCGYKTPPRKIAPLLEELFGTNESKSGYWLHIAQHWSPRTINWVISAIIKQHKRGDRTIRKPAAYFVYLIKRRKQRKVFRKVKENGS